MKRFDLALWQQVQQEPRCWTAASYAPRLLLYMRAYSRIGDMLIVRKHAAKPIAIHTLPELQADNAAPGN